MRVLTVGNQYPAEPSGGYELVWRSAVAALRERGHQVRVITTDHDPPAPQDGAEDVHRDLRWYWRDHAFPRRSLVACLALERHNRRVLRRHLDELRPDVVAWWSMGGMSLSLLEQVRRRGAGAVAFVHDDWLDYGRRVDGWYRRFRRRPGVGAAAERMLGIPTHVDFAAAARYGFVSEATRAHALVSGVALHESFVAHSGIDLPLLSPPAEPHDWDWRLLYVGRLDARKGIETALRAVAALPSATLTVAGGGDRAETERLEALARELGVGDRVDLAGVCPRSQLRSRYAECDAVVFPVTWAEPWGLVPLEAMAVGRPVLATGRGGSGEYLRDGHNCLRFEAGDADALAAAVRRLAADRDLRERLRQGGLETAPRHTEAHFNAAVVDAVEQAAGGDRLPQLPRRLPGRAGAAAARPGRPRVSVVIPTLDRNDRLERCLDALAAQEVARDEFEVIVVPDPSRAAGDFDDLLAGAGRRMTVRRVDRHDPGVGAARNAGWRAARAPVVLFLGDDILAAPDLLGRHLAWHDAAPDARIGVLGHVRWAREIDVTPFMRWLEHGLQFNYPSIDGIDAGFGHFYTANISLKREMLKRVDGFDEQRFPFLYEDIDLGYRLYRAGFRLLYNRRARTEHLHPSTVDQWRGRMRAAAAAERRWVSLRPEFEAYFHDRFADAAARPPHHGRAVRLLPWVPPGVPVLGPAVWDRATLYYRQQLAPDFLRAWEQAQPGEDGASASSEPGEVLQPGGSSPGGPK